MWTLCSYNIYISVIVIITEDYLCYIHIYRIFCHVTLLKNEIENRADGIYFCATITGRRCIVPHTYLLYFLN